MYDSGGAAVRKNPIRGICPACCALASGAAKRLRARMTASPISRMLPGSLAERRNAHQRAQQKGRSTDPIGQRSADQTVLTPEFFPRVFREKSRAMRGTSQELKRFRRKPVLLLGVPQHHDQPSLRGVSPGVVGLVWVVWRSR